MSVNVLRGSVRILNDWFGISFISWIAFLIAKTSAVKMLFGAGSQILLTELFITIAKAILVSVSDASVNTKI